MLTYYAQNCASFAVHSAKYSHIIDRNWVTGVNIIYSYISLKREKINELNQLDDCTIRVQ